MNDLIKNHFFELEPGTKSFYGDVFQGCSFKCNGWDGKFMNCVFADCKFDPPLDLTTEPWLNRHLGSVIS